MRLVRKPILDDGNMKEALRLFSLLVLATWGDARDPGEKPGMQYVPVEMRQLLHDVARLNWRARRALKRLGDRTRYGASIRAFSDLLFTLVGESIRNPTPTFMPVEVDLEVMRPHLGRLLNHRCEPAFNPDREPAKNREKTEALLDIAHTVLYTERTRCLALIERALTELAAKAKAQSQNRYLRPS